MSGYRLCGLSLGLFLAWLPVSAQVPEDSSVEVYTGSGPARRMSLIPRSAKLLFANSKVYFDKRDVRVSLPIKDGVLLQNMELGTVRSYSPEQSPKDGPTKQNENFRVPSARITAVVNSDKIYVVNELFCDENISVINRLLRSLSVSVDNPEKAMEVAKFFLQLGYYRFEDPDKFTVSTYSDLSTKQMEFPGQDAAEIQRAIRPPVATKDGDTYTVEIVTKESDAALVELHHWNIRILGSQISDVQEEVPVPASRHYRAGEAPSSSMRGTLASEVSTLRFQLAIIGDGVTSDSKELNVSTYTFDTSEGPQVSRSAYRFKSPVRAVKEFDSQLHLASQIIERGNWTDGQEDVLGERALVLYSFDGSARVRAAILLRRDTRYFAISSLCLRNLLEFEKIWFHSDSKPPKK
jgi:hypothetical protein